MWTPNAVVSPPYPWGPIPRRFARSSNSFSSASSCGSGLGEPSSRNSAFFERIAAFSNVPPMPTPRMSGGHASGPAVLTHSMIHSFTPARPSAGVSILYFDRFSQPPPLAMTMIPSVAPGTMVMDDGGRVVAGVHAIERRADDRRAEVALLVALPHALVDGVVQTTPGDVHVLAQLDEADDEARVLAVWDEFGPRHLRVVLQDLEHLLARGRALALERSVEGAEHVRLEREVRLHAELLDRVGDRADVNLAHALTSSFSAGRPWSPGSPADDGRSPRA